MAMTQAFDASSWSGAELEGWREAHAALSRLARERAVADAEEGRWLLAARRARAHQHLGYACFGEYVERLFGYSRRTTAEKLRVAEALERLSGLQHALGTGRLGWSVVRELTRVAEPETEHAWLEAARGKTVRELEALVAGKAPGASPGDEARSELRRHVLRFEVSSETFALFREAMAQAKRQGGGGLNDDEVLLTLARQALGGPSDDGRASYQIVLDVCDRCGRGEQHSSGATVAVSTAAVDLACCDGQHLGRFFASPGHENAGESPDAPGPALGFEAACTQPGPSEAARSEAGPSKAGASEVGRAEVGRAEVGRAERSHPMPSQSKPARPDAAPCGGSSGGATSSARPSFRSEAPLGAHVGSRRPLPRATQTMPPALRRAVLLRDHHRCQVTGCSHAIFVDVHHLRARSEGGLHSLANLITLCAAHHRAAHRGELVISGVPGALHLQHADGTPYGEPPDAERADAHAKVFSALRQLGFRERDVRAVLTELRGDVALRRAPVEELLRQALMRIRQARG